MLFTRLYRFVLLAAAGAMVFQTTTSCATQLVEEFATTFGQAVSSAAVTAINDALQGTSTT